MCTKFGAFFIKCTIDLVYAATLFYSLDEAQSTLIEHTTKKLLWYPIIRVCKHTSTEWRSSESMKLLMHAVSTEIHL